ncbi:MAG: 23S rRNA pseudouridine(1911/1915/1917) synthase RluD [Gammaproteobacteria bacterium]|nr:MAG: 23S rRNA pseudouridine(1911/1915/1917) synthase RluD [Gammaproteobacteria bacterium]
MSEKTIQLVEAVPSALHGARLDAALTDMLGDFSRGLVQKWIKEGGVCLNGQVCTKPKTRVSTGDVVELNGTFEVQGDWQPEDICVPVLYEDEQLIVVNKPVGLVVHPGNGHWQDTMINGLLARYPELAQLPRAGVVHRLDKDTSGVLVVARDPRAHASLVAQLQERAFARTYLAIVNEVPIGGGTVDAPIGRHPIHRTRMSVVEGGKEAVTHYKVKEKFRRHALLEVKLETGRTHQIRVHMSHIGHPLVGDGLYGGRPKLPQSPSETLVEAIRGFRRQALHAAVLGLSHPVTGQWMQWQAPVPDDMAHLLDVLREDKERSSDPLD